MRHTPRNDTALISEAPSLARGIDCETDINAPKCPWFFVMGSLCMGLVSFWVARMAYGETGAAGSDHVARFG